jgi:hypothetical protein
VVPRFQGDAVVIAATFGHPTRAELDADAIHIASAFSSPVPELPGSSLITHHSSF